MKLLNIMVLVCILAASGFNALAPAQAVTTVGPFDVTKAPNCGVRAVIIMAQALRRPNDDAKQRALCNRYPTERVSLLEVKNAATELGLNLQGKRVSLQELQDRPRLAIVALKDHFAFVDCVTSDWVRVFDGTAPTLQPRHDFEQLYQGMALVYEPEITRGLLNVETPILDVKSVAANTPLVMAQTVIRNVGKNTVHISAVTTSCTCTVTSSYPKEVAPGASFVMKCKVQPPSVGRINSTVLVNSDAQRPLEWINIVGDIDSVARLSPPQLLFDHVLVGNSMQRTVKLVDDSHALGTSLSIMSSSPQVKAELQGEASSNSRQIVVTLVDTLSPGVLKETIFIKDGQGKTRLLLPIKAIIASDLEFQPEKLFMGDLPAHESSRKTVVIHSQSNNPFRLSKTTCEDYRVQIVADNTITATAHAVEIRINALDPWQTIDTSLRIFTSDGRMCILPIYMQATATNAPAQAKLAVGQPAPNFSLADATGVTRRLSDLHEKKNLLLTFFPRCFTGGCADQLASLQHELDSFARNNTEVWAVSVDPATGEEGQRAFAAKLGLSFPLLPDTQRTICKLYGAARSDNDLAARQSILIDKNGIVRWIDTEVDVHTHGADMLVKLRELGLSK